MRLIEDAVAEWLRSLPEQYEELGDLWEVRDVDAQKITQPRGVVVLRGGAGRLAPSPDGDGVEWFDYELALALYSRVGGQNKTLRAEARADVAAQASALARAVYGDPSLGGGVYDARLGEVALDETTIGGEPYAVAALTLYINEAGKPVDRREL